MMRSQLPALGKAFQFDLLCAPYIAGVIPLSVNSKCLMVQLMAS